MLDVWLPTTDGRWLVMPRYTQPEPEQAILLHKLQLSLPQQPPSRGRNGITASSAKTWDWAAIPKRLTRACPKLEMAPEHVNPRKLAGQYLILSDEQWAEFEHDAYAAWERFTSVQPPTSYEDPNLYRSLAMTFDQIQTKKTRPCSRLPCWRL